MAIPYTREREQGIESERVNLSYAWIIARRSCTLFFQFYIITLCHYLLFYSPQFFLSFLLPFLFSVLFSYNFSSYSRFRIYNRAHAADFLFFCVHIFIVAEFSNFFVQNIGNQYVYQRGFMILYFMCTGTNMFYCKQFHCHSILH